MHPMQRVNAPVGAQQHHDHHQGVDRPQVVLLPAVLHRFGNEKRADVMGNAAQRVQGYQLQRRQHQARFFPVIQGKIQGIQNVKIAHGEKHRHKKAKPDQAQPYAQLLQVHPHQPGAGLCFCFLHGVFLSAGPRVPGRDHPTIIAFFCQFCQSLLSAGPDSSERTP